MEGRYLFLHMRSLCLFILGPTIGLLLGCEFHILSLLTLLAKLDCRQNFLTFLRNRISPEAIKFLETSECHRAICQQSLICDCTGPDDNVKTLVCFRDEELTI